MEITNACSLLASRQSGILLHISSLPSGKLGEDAFRFVDYLKESAFRIWQILPLCPTHANGSPYDGTSAFAGNPTFIETSGIIKKYYPENSSMNTDSLFWAKCYSRFKEIATKNEIAEFDLFVTVNGFWVKDYALFYIIKEQQEFTSWVNWPRDLKFRNRTAIDIFSNNNRMLLDGIIFQQYQFYQQWKQLKAYANSQGILIVGDVPFFVSHDSADCWSNSDQFLLDQGGNPEVVAGVPPDYFSKDGQRWGNPHYNWALMETEHFSWWKSRLQHSFRIFDLIRIDHFRGFEACWRIANSELTAINGFWEKTPGASLFSALLEEYHQLPIIAEDLGIITAEVETLRDKFGFPGMKILQFAFDGNCNNPYLPHNHCVNSVVYTGTHDNDTSRGWFESLDKQQQKFVQTYFGCPQEPFPLPLVRSVLSSVANTAIVPMQDILSLSSEHRMNTPGTISNNWHWKFQWQQLTDELSDKLKDMNSIYNRIPN